MELGKGRAEAVSDDAMAALAREIGCHPADLEAIAEVESNGFGWFPDGRIKILFEKHWIYRNLSGTARKRAVQAGLARKKWIAPKAGGYSDQATADQRYVLLARAIEIDEEAALRSISMGRFQIMGFNYSLCGFTSARQMWAAFCDSEKHQLRAFASFLHNKRLGEALRNRDFARIEDVYNGGGLGGAYARRMARKSDQLRAGKWQGWEEREGGASEPVLLAPAPLPNPKPIAKSRTAGGAGLAAGGGAAVLVPPVREMVDVIEGQKEALSSGDLIAMVIGGMVIAGAALALYARLDDGGYLDRWLPWRRRAA
ncbi:uncharacterized protein DUF3380 [Breoghania corrubedonensis]|uniref:Uncharacterized protein DUF3380 n=1 Tax=Breoghania corrubedonensis TaxID=665038 RepID=A0A2T5UR26_9HYPH|nr:N-acetylmuramidase family protein [Breoghania corrubedonensis]PTW53933.1 uncharacterized protein DUF3380 [Breoghania corrubedonensis]